MNSTIKPISSNSTTFSPHQLSTTLPTTILATPETLIISEEHENLTSTDSSDYTGVSQESLSFILVPIIIILGVALISALTIYCIQKRQRLDNLRHTLIPLYTYNRREDEWGVLLDNHGRINGRDSR